jgi:hypothetical protein
MSCRTVEDFLLVLWREGALLGDKPEQAFFVDASGFATAEAAEYQRRKPPKGSRRVVFKHAQRKRSAE